MRGLTIVLVAATVGVSTGCGPSRIGTIDPSEVPSRNDEAWRITAEPAPAASEAPDPSPSTPGG